MSTILKRPFRSHPLLRSGHAQTLAAVYLPHNGVPGHSHRRHVRLPDGDVLVLHEHDDAPGWKPGDRVALFIHGLSGSAGSRHMLHTAAKLSRRGVRAFRLDLRGAGAGWRLASKPYHAGCSGDVAEVIASIAASFPGSPLTVIGYSMGGNIALKLLGEAGGSPPGHLDSGLAVAPPVDLSACSRRLTRGLNRLYDKNFARCLSEQFMRRQRAVPGLRRVSLSPRPRRLIEFDERVTAPLWGFSSAEDYYRRTSSAPLPHRITLPVQIIAAADDPLVPVDLIERSVASTPVDAEIVSGGGHLGFVTVRGTCPDRWWLDWRIVEWVTQLPRRL